jgi:hypothetical protein
MAGAGLNWGHHDLQRAVWIVRAREIPVAAPQAQLARTADRGRAGYRDLAGLVLIDGGLPLAPTSLTPAKARTILDEIATEGPRLDVLGQRRPYLYGVLSAVAGLYADTQPQRPSPLDNLTPPLPFQPPFPATNQTWLGLASQFFYPPRGEALAHAGHPAAGGDPRPWIDGDDADRRDYCDARPRDTHGDPSLGCVALSRRGTRDNARYPAPASAIARRDDVGPHGMTAGRRPPQQ